jgi:hypothetical protein
MVVRRNKMGREDEIRMIAYALWVRDEKCYGKAIKHWLEAEAIWKQNQEDIKLSLLYFEESGKEAEKTTLAGIC